MIQVRLNDTCGVTPCGLFIDKWAEWAANKGTHEMAMLEVTDPNHYFASLTAKSRNMIRKVNRIGIKYCQFIWDDHLDDVHDINVSMPVRSGGPMLGSYLNPPHRSSSVKPCVYHHTAYIGGFLDQTLKAYCVLAVVNELAVINQILGHKDALSYGVMNGLIEALNRHCYGTSVKYINYLSLGSSPDGLRRFKESVGFKPQQVVFTQGD